MSDSQLDLNNEDLVGKIVRASTLENEGQTKQAIALYQEISQQDPNGNYGNVAREALANLQKQSESLVTEKQSEQIKSNFPASFWNNASLKIKVPVLIATIATLPVLALGLTAYYITDKAIEQNVAQLETVNALDLQDKINLFMRSRYDDIQTMAAMDVFSDPQINATPQRKTAALERIKSFYGVYESIAIFDLKGEPIAQTQAGKKLSNHLNRIYIQDALKTNGAVLSRPLVSSTSGTVSVYSASPIKDKATGKTIGFIRARIPVKHIATILKNHTLGDRQYYLLDGTGDVFLDSSGNLSTDTLSSGKAASQTASASELVTAEKVFADIASVLDSSSVTTTVTKNLQSNIKQLIAYVPPNSASGLPDLNWSVITATDTALATQRKLALIMALGTIAITILVAISALTVARKFVEPIVLAADAVEKLGAGEFDTRIAISGKDELADLGTNINKMAGQIQDLLHTQETEAKRQRVEKEKLQKGVMGLLLDVEEAKRGDLTVRAQMSDGAVGSIADAFNSTLRKLQELLQEVQNVSTEVGQLSQAGEGSVRKLSESALTQAAEIDYALSSIDEINQSVKTIADYAREAATIARNGSIQAKEGDLAMDATVNSIEKIRATVANTSKKVKQLAESSQEIAQIVEIISGISEKTNLLAFNASVEAARAGEHGEGFRIVAEEVRRLADRTTEATKDIQQLVTTIQQDTTSVLQGMETSTSEVVNGSELVHMTKLNLRSLAQTSEQIDEYLKSISTNTTKQTDNSKQINEKINGIALVAKNTSNEAQSVVESLQTLVQEAQTLQESVSQFKLQS